MKFASLALYPIGDSFSDLPLGVLLRRRWLAAGVVVLFIAVLAYLISGSIFGLFVGGLIAGCLVLALFRFGLITLISMSLVHAAWLLPVTNFSAWFEGNALVGMAFVLALAGYAFYISRGGQKLFEGKLLNE